MTPHGCPTSIITFQDFTLGLCSFYSRKYSLFINDRSTDIIQKSVERFPNDGDGETSKYFKVTLGVFLSLF